MARLAFRRTAPVPRAATGVGRAAFPAGSTAALRYGQRGRRRSLPRRRPSGSTRSTPSTPRCFVRVVPEPRQRGLDRGLLEADARAWAAAARQSQELRARDADHPRRFRRHAGRPDRRPRVRALPGRARLRGPKQCCVSRSASASSNAWRGDRIEFIVAALPLGGFDACSTSARVRSRRPNLVGLQPADARPAQRDRRRWTTQPAALGVVVRVVVLDRMGHESRRSCSDAGSVAERAGLRSATCARRVRTHRSGATYRCPICAGHDQGVLAANGAICWSRRVRRASRIQRRSRAQQRIPADEADAQLMPASASPPYTEPCWAT